MPSNFTESLNTIGAPSYGVGKPAPDYSDNIATAGKAIAALGELYSERKEDEYVGSFSTAVSDVESQVSNYAEATRELYRQRDQATSEQYKTIQSEIDKYVRGEVQGSLSPTKARLALDNLVKVYGSRNPALAKEIRLMANAAKGQFNEILNEAHAMDPDTKAALTNYAEARKNGMIPSEYLEMEGAKRDAGLAQQNVEQLKLLGEVTEGRLIKSTQSFALSRGNEAYYRIVNDLDKAFKSGVEPTNAQIEGLIANEYASIEREAWAMLRSGQEGDLNAMGIFNIGEKEFNDVIAGPKEAFARLKTFLTGSEHTWDNKVKMLREIKSKFEDQTTMDLFADNGIMGAMARAELVAKGTGTLIFNGIVTTQGMMDRHMGNGASKDNALGRVLDFADSAAATGKPEAAFQLYAGAEFIKSGHSVDSLMNFILGKGYKTGNPVVDAVTGARATAGFNQASPAQKQEAAKTMIHNYDWERLVKHPEMADTVSKDPQLTAVAVGMATRHVLKVLSSKGDSLDSVQFDPLRAGSGAVVNPFNYKQPIGISRERTEAVLELNKTYQNLLRMFGGDVAGEWVRSLVQPDTAHGLSTTGNFGLSSAEKKSKFSDVRMGETMSYVLQRNREAYNLPEELVMALGDMESALGMNLTSSTSTAKGPLAIIDDTFEGMNRQMFEGKLDQNNMFHRGEAALAHLADLYHNTYKGDTTKTLLHYFTGKPGGSPEAWATVDANGVPAPRYVQDVYDNMVKYRAM